MRYTILTLLLSFCCKSCQVSETLTLDEKGQGSITVTELRDEQSYMQLVGEEYTKESFFKDETYLFQDVIVKHQETFARLPDFEKAIFQKYAAVTVHEFKSAIEKIFRTTIKHSFNAVEEIPDLYKTEDYADDIVNNYALVAEEHYYVVSFCLKDNVFSRKVNITNPTELKKQQDEISNLKKRYDAFNLKQNLLLDYHFARKIKSVSNPLAQISEDRKSLQLKLLLSDCLSDPESTNLEVFFE